MDPVISTWPSVSGDGPTRIPRIVHQLWKTEEIPPQWRKAVQSVRRFHDGWEYRLWTDNSMDDFVRERLPAFYPTFAGLSRQIMRVDVFRYVLMSEIGGMYCDLDYEFLRPFDYADKSIVLAYEREQAMGDDNDMIANFVFASVAGHPFWRDVLADVQAQPPAEAGYINVGMQTGPGLLTRVYAANWQRYHDVTLCAKPVFSPRRIHGKHEKKVYLNSGITYGVHHGWGSWRDRISLRYWLSKYRKWFGLKDPGRG